MDISSSSFFNSFRGNQVSTVQTGTPGKNASASEEIAPSPGNKSNTKNERETDTSTDASNSEKNNTATQGNKQNSAEISSQLTQEETQKVQELKQRDQEVRTHEAAHLAAAGKYATGGASFDYKRGPDGKNYAVGGEVGIDTSPVPNDPQATIQKAQQIKAAAQAPAQPSSTDRQVAASAAQMEAQARQDMAEQRLSGEDESNKVSASDDNEKSDETESPGDNNTKAASAYQSVNDLTENAGKSLIDLVA